MSKKVSKTARTRSWSRFLILLRDISYREQRDRKSCSSRWRILWESQTVWDAWRDPCVKGGRKQSATEGLHRVIEDLWIRRSSIQSNDTLLRETECNTFVVRRPLYRARRFWSYQWPTPVNENKVRNKIRYSDEKRRYRKRSSNDSDDRKIYGGDYLDRAGTDW